MAVETQRPVDQAKVEEFAARVLGNTSGAMVSLLASIGDRLGLFRELARGPATSAELAVRARVNERYAREWLGGMASAGYLTHDRKSGRFSLPPEAVPVLAQEGGPHFLGGLFQMLPPMTRPFVRLATAFRTGRGVPQSEYDEDFWAGMERFTAGWFENFLLDEWLPGMPDVQAKLEYGARLADVGCGSGRALVKLAKAFPNSTFDGYDVTEQQLERARENVKAAGVQDRVKLHRADAAEGLPEQYDIVTTFDVVHDAVNPRGLLKAIRQGLKPDGIYVCLDMNGAADLDGNAGPVGSLFYGFSLLYCLTTSLANGGEGLGTLGFHEQRVRDMAGEAGFADVRRVPIDHPFNCLYEIRP